MARVLESHIRIPDVRGLNRDRLDVLFAAALRHRLTCVVAPAGSGKTTAISQFARNARATADMRVAWVTADSLDLSVDALLTHLAAAIGVALERPALGPWQDVLDVIAELADLDESLLIVVDDVHLLDDGAGLGALSAILHRLPHNVTVVLGARRLPHLDLTGMRLDGQVLDIDADDLRFRTWEAERLLNDTHGLSLQPDDVARLTRQLGGWAAGLQLFRLAAVDRTPTEQRHLARSTSTRSPLAREYLAANLLGALPPEHRDFLVRTSVLGVVSGPMADDFLDRTNSSAMLRDLERADVFVSSVDDGVYRYHEVLRAHLETELDEQTDAAELMRLYEDGAHLLEAAGLLSDAVRCYLRIGADDDIARILSDLRSDLGAQETVDVAALIERASGLGDDPWIHLVQARAHVVAGSFAQAIAEYRLAEDRFAGLRPALTCRRERLEVTSFVDVATPAASSWVGELRRGLQSDPRGALQRLDGTGTPEATLAAGFIGLIAGLYPEAATAFEHALTEPDPPDWLMHAARLGSQLVRLAGDHDDTAATSALAERLMAQLDGTWVGRVALPICGATIGSAHGTAAVTMAQRCENDGDPWGAAISTIYAALVDVQRGDLGEAITHAASGAQLAARLDSDVLGSSAYAILAAARDDPAGDDRIHAERLARRAGLRHPPIDTLLASARPATAVRGRRAEGTASTVPTTRCFGGFALAGQADAVASLRPQARTVLMRLALDTGSPVTTETLIDDVWGPEATSSAARGVQVAVSAIRRAFADDGVERTVERTDHGYVLTEVDGGQCDIVQFRMLARAVLRHDPTDTTATADQVREALAVITGELLPEAGSQEWILAARDHVELLAARVAGYGARVCLDVGDAASAAEFGERGLELARYDDDLWRVTIEAHDRLGNAVAAARLRSSYADLVAELAPDGGPQVSPSPGTRAR